MYLRKINRIVKTGFIFFIILFFLNGCTLGIVKVTGVSITGGNKVMRVGETLQLSVKIEPSDATNTIVFWESSDTSKLIVDDKGLVKAVAMPGAEITVITKDGKFENTIIISVVPENSNILNNTNNSCNTCDPCNPCNQCNTGNQCNTCDPCNTCNPCNECDPCNTCEPCNPCNQNNSCNTCDPCNQNDPCNQCNTGNQCNTCEPKPCNPCDPNGDCYNPCACQSNTCNP